jgi:DNA-binding GntR family transcriptional regulator
MRTEAVYDQLRDDIVSGALAPGAKLRFVELTERYGASMGVTREALSRLSEQGFVTSEPQLGFRVVSLSVNDLLDLTEARCHIETLALASSMEHGTVEWESNLLAAHHGLSRTPQRGKSNTGLARSWAEAHEQFHQALIASCPNRRLQSLATGLRANAEIYRHWTAGDHTRSIDDEHQAMCDAALARDIDRARELLTDHLVATARLLLRSAPEATAEAMDRLNRIETRRSAP